MYALLAGFAASFAVKWYLIIRIRPDSVPRFNGAFLVDSLRCIRYAASMCIDYRCRNATYLPLCRTATPILLFCGFQDVLTVFPFGT
jgi:hypothetical protein